MAVFGALFWLWGQLHSPGWPVRPSLLAGVIGALLLALTRSIGWPAKPFAGRRQLAALIGVAGVVLVFGLSQGVVLAGRSALAIPGLTLGLSWIWRQFLRGVVTDPGAVWREDLRIAAIVSTASWVFHAYCTHRFIGGLDAKWYLSNMTDAIEQFRAGVFPVMVGQGEHMFNGGVHPFRSAPYHHYLGMLLDTLSFRVFSPAGLQHLTAVVSAIQGGFLFYRGLTWLEPGRPWRASALALIYVSSPVMLAYLVNQEMYMTVMTFAYLPLLVYANVRVLRQDDARSCAMLAAAVAVVWFCHPVTGMVVLMFTAGLQGFRLLAWDFTMPAWRRAAGGVLLGGVLAAYVLWSMRETGSTKLGQPRTLAVEIVAWLAAAVALLRMMAAGRLVWLPVVLLAGWAISGGQRMTGIWFYFAGVLGAIVVLLGKRWNWWADRDRLAWRVAGIALLAGLIAVNFYAEKDGRRLAVANELIAILGFIHPRYVMPMAPLAVELGDMQLGYALWGLLALGVVTALVSRRRDLSLVSVAGLAMVSVVLPIPGVTRFVATILPDQVYYTVGTNLWMRITPTLAAVAAFAGALAVMRWHLGSRLKMAAGLLGFVVIVGWNAVELLKPIGRADRATSSTAHTRDVLRLENSQLYRYAYDLLPVPGYFLTGVMDYHLENRLLAGPKLEALPDPVLAARPSPPIELATRPDVADPRWVYVKQRISVGPGERQAWVFEFAPHDFTGQILLRGNHGFYRSYQLPTAGFSPKAFGSAPGNSRLLPIWNSTAQPEDIEIIYLLGKEPDGDPELRSLGRLWVVPYRVHELQVRTLSLMPYVAEVDLKEAAALETFRAFLPGYVAKVDGNPVPVERSPDDQVMIRLGPGTHRIDLVYRGSLGLWFALVVSVAGWFGLFLAYGLPARANAHPA